MRALFAVQNRPKDKDDRPRSSDNERLADLRGAIHEILDGVAHDFRTPLTVIKEFATLMGEGLVGDVGPRQREFLEVINDRADDLTLAVDNVLDAGKSDAGVLRAWRRATDAGEVVRGVQAAVARKTRIKGISLEVTVDTGLPAVWVDRDQLARILLNLIAGALKKFEDPRGMRIRACADGEAGRVLFALTIKGRVSRKQIDSIASVFDPARPCDLRGARDAAWRFSLARQLVDLHFGRIWLDGARQGETTFCVSLPVSQPRYVLEDHARRRASKKAAGAQLVGVSAGAKVHSATAGVVDEFLQSSVGIDDLAVQMDAHRWLLALDARRAREVLGEIESSWAGMRKGRHGGRLPRLKLARLGYWNPAEGADVAMGRFASKAVARKRPRRVASEGAIVAGSRTAGAI